MIKVSATVLTEPATITSFPTRVFFKSDAITNSVNCNPIREPIVIDGKFARRYTLVNCLFPSPPVETGTLFQDYRSKKKREQSGGGIGGKLRYRNFETRKDKIL